MARKIGLPPCEVEGFATQKAGQTLKSVLCKLCIIPKHGRQACAWQMKLLPLRSTKYKPSIRTWRCFELALLVVCIDRLSLSQYCRGAGFKLTMKRPIAVRLVVRYGQANCNRVLIGDLKSSRSCEFSSQGPCYRTTARKARVLCSKILPKIVRMQDPTSRCLWRVGTRGLLKKNPR